MPDDPSNDNDTSNFDDWLSEESAPPTDPAVVSPATSQDGLDATSEIEMGDIADASGSHAGDQSDVELESDESEDLLSEDLLSAAADVRRFLILNWYFDTPPIIF